jgi:hypothetical protein
MENITRKKILGRSFILRRRVAHKRPLGYKKGECYHGLHAGLFSLYVSLRKPQKQVNISIKDK